MRFVHVRAQKVFIAEGLVAVLAKRLVRQNIRRLGLVLEQIGHGLARLALG